MKSKPNRFVCLFTAFCFALLCMICSFGQSTVSALSNNFPEAKFASNMAESQAKLLIQQFYDNTTVIAKGFNEYNSILCFSFRGYDNTYDVLCILGGEYTYHQTRYYNRGWYDAYSYIIDRSKNDKYIYCQSVQNISTYDFSTNSTELYSNGYTIVGVNYCPSYNNFYYCKYINPSNDYHIYNYPSEFTSYVYNDGYIPPYEPSNVLYGLDLGINEADFYQWIIDNNKLSEIPSYIGMSKLASFIHFYNQFGSNNSNFLNNIKDWFSYMNIANQTNDNIIILKSTFDKLYQEFINSYWYAIYPDFSNLPHHRRNIQTQTTDTDTTLITDDSNDTLDISILRDILRGVISVNNSVCDGVISLVNALENLDFVVNLSNGGGMGVTDLSVLWVYDSDAFNDDLQLFIDDIEDVQSVPQGYISTINQNALMPENVLEDKNSLTVHIPTVTGFTVGNNGSSYSTQTGTYELKSSDYPWLDTVSQKIKRFASILLIIGYLVHLRYRIPELIRGE